MDQLLLAKELLKFEQMDESIKFLLAYKALSKEDKKSVFDLAIMAGRVEI